ncbi:class I SAM-dependent methyltransferase [Actinophytocola sp.]|jgi:ubiquinone/menaquinone biosynthesis C-methylase UbiE|uniref:class I SAM-dependent methyltransferase n=1 Tax=Actinophytocola sp. TaxID=1872138 RepID=UPI002EDB9637
MRTRVNARVPRYNRIAHDYDAMYGAECGVMHRLVLAEIDDRDLAPGTVLDVGCGTGALLELLARRLPAAGLTGADPSEGMIRRARARLPSARFVVCGAEALDVDDGAIDLVVSTTSFGQWADQAAGLREVRRVLRPDGTGVVIEHRLPSLLKRLIYRLPDLATPDTMVGMVRDAGLVVHDQRVVGDDYLVTVVGRRR